MGITKSESGEPSYNDRMQTMTRPLGSRSRSDDGQLRITQRVLSMLDAIARAGLLTTDQIARRDGGSRQKVHAGFCNASSS